MPLMVVPNGEPLQKCSLMSISIQPSTKYICAILAVAVGSYALSAFSASIALPRVCCGHGLVLLLPAGTARRSLSSVWKNVSPDIHSSVSVPPADHMLTLPPVAEDSDCSAPATSASAPMALPTEAGPIVPGCCGSSN